MKILISTKYLSEMIEEAISKNCRLFTLLPANELIHFTGPRCDFKKGLSIIDNQNEGITGYTFDYYLFEGMLSFLKQFEEQPILLVFYNALPDKLHIRLFSQIETKDWSFLS